MRYDDARLLDALAREYVVGTLTGPARALRTRARRVAAGTPRRARLGTPTSAARRVRAAPVSLGLIPGTGDAALPLSAAQRTVLAQTATLAVSLEPAGGSPTGAQTGPVIFTAPLLSV